jgi:hypothetical protein
MSSIRTKLNNSVIASKIEIDYVNIDFTKKLMEKQLSQKKLKIYCQESKYRPTIYHIDSLYRDNTLDRYEFINR